MSPPKVLTDGRTGSYSLLLRNLADRLFRQKNFILKAFLLLNLAAGGYLLWLPTAYEAEIKFLVNNIRADAVVTPESSNGQVARTYVDEAVIATEIQLLSNRVLLRDVVVRCGLAEDSSDISVERAVRELQKALKISPVLKANMIKASYSSPNPKETAAVLQAMADGYLNEHLRVHSSSGVYEFFNRQALHYQRQLRDLQTRLSEFQQPRNIVLLGQQKDLNLRKMVDLEGALKETEAARLENEQRIRKLRSQLAGLTPRITTQARKLPNQYSVERLNTMLAELQNRRTELLTKFRPDDRMIKQLDQQIADTRLAMDRANNLFSAEEATDVNPLRQSLEAELAKAELNATGLRARAAGLTDQVAEYRRSLGSLQHATPDDDQLLRDIKEAEDSFFLYSKKREEARIAEAMDRQKIANVVLVEPPKAPQIPRQKLTGSLAAGYLLCCLIILGIAFFIAITKNTVYTPWELEGLTGLPVLASFCLRTLPPPSPRLESGATLESIR
ncbi:MAG: hypothetical protein HYR60_18865 [Acidobacteria bacterium]|nr:hypothetical protein [Acidobacteriota bacterium]